MDQTLVILVVGLSPSLLGKHTPNLNRLVERGGMCPMTTTLPAVTCSMQSTLLTGAPPATHGAVANGWYFRDLSEIWLWRQSNKLIGGEKIWDAARKRNPDFTTAKMFWWYNMYADVEWSATPRPMYPADGRKIPDHYAWPKELHDELDSLLGQFPLFKFWGPTADITSSEWITQATMHVMATRDPTLTLTYLPHLDYNLQRLGPETEHPTIQQDLSEIDALCGQLIDAADKSGRHVIVVSEYGITPVVDAIHINRTLREAGWLEVRNEKGREQLDAGASKAFAVADHQIAHVYVRDDLPPEQVKSCLQAVDGIEHVYDKNEQAGIGLDHERSGELVAVSAADRWFSYYYWLDKDCAPDYARTVDIHRKPGYDPVELFVDPKLKAPKLTIGRKIIARKLGIRNLLDVISEEDTQLVKGSHGRPTDNLADGPLVISSRADLLSGLTAPSSSKNINQTLDATAFKSLVLAHCFDPESS